MTSCLESLVFVHVFSLLCFLLLSLSLMVVGLDYRILLCGAEYNMGLLFVRRNSCYLSFGFLRKVPTHTHAAVTFKYVYFSISVGKLQ